jgi:hypothetical protein
MKKAPLPFLLGEVITEIITSTEMPRLYKIETLLKNPAFASKFVV